MPAGARNPKTAQFTVRVDDGINGRVEAIADRMGLNKATTAAMLIAAGLNIFEPVMGVGVSPYVEQATNDKLAQLTGDIEAAAPGILTKK